MSTIVDFFESNDALMKPAFPFLLGRSGPDYKVCFETFIENCDQYIEKIKKIQQEAREHMTIMIELEKE